MILVGDKAATKKQERLVFFQRYIRGRGHRSCLLDSRASRTSFHKAKADKKHTGLLEPPRRLRPATAAGPNLQRVLKGGDKFVVVVCYYWPDGGWGLGLSDATFLLSEQA